MSELEIHHNDPGRFWASRGPKLADAVITVVARIRADYAAFLELVGEIDRADIHQLAGYGSPRCWSRRWPGSARGRRSDC